MDRPGIDSGRRVTRPWLWLWLVAGACATPAAVPRDDGRVAASPRPFAPYVPSPAHGPPTADERALAAEGGEAQARRMVISLVEALLLRDGASLGDLFADRVAIVREGRSLARADAVKRCMAFGGRFGWQTEARPDDAVDLEGIEVQRAEGRHQTGHLPGGIRASDLVVDVELRAGFEPPGGRRARICLSEVYVRPGQTPRIVGLMR